MGDAGLRVVGHRAAELLELDLLAGDRLDHVGAGDEHVRRLLDHEDEVGHGGGVDGAAGARAHDHADLGDHAGALDVADEDVAVAAERDDALLDPGAAGVVDADHRRADLGGHVHDLDHLLRHDLAERAAEDREVLAEDEDRAAVDLPVAGDDGVAPGPVLLHVEVVGPVADEGVELLEGAGVEQLLDPLAGGELALGVLLLDRRLGGGVDRRVAQLPQVAELLLEGLGALDSRIRTRQSKRSRASPTSRARGVGGEPNERGPSASGALERVVADRRADDRPGEGDRDDHRELHRRPPVGDAGVEDADQDRELPEKDPVGDQPEPGRDRVLAGSGGTSPCARLRTSPAARPAARSARRRRTGAGSRSCRRSGRPPTGDGLEQARADATGR